jgi:hypothetical protein
LTTPFFYVIIYLLPDQQQGSDRITLLEFGGVK